MRKVKVFVSCNLSQRCFKAFREGFINSVSTSMEDVIKRLPDREEAEFDGSGYLPIHKTPRIRLINEAKRVTWILDIS